MAEPNRPPSNTPPLALPPAMLDHTTAELHPDSEEFVGSERHVTAHELEPIDEPSACYAHSFSIRSRGASSWASTPYTLSEVPTATDFEGPGSQDERRYRLRRQVPHWYDPIVKLWTSQVSVTIDEGSHRDHLALERTFLGYLRTSLVFAMSGVIIAQLFRLQRSVSPDEDFGFYVLGTPLAATFIGVGLIVLLVGAYRFWRQQSAIIRGKVHAGGWEISGIMLISIVLCFIVFVLIVAVDIDKSYQ